MSPTAPSPRTPVAILGTLAEFHWEPIPYDLGALVRLVTRLHPDLLCLDLTREQWEQRDFGSLPPEYRNALLPLAHQTDIVVVPIAGDRPAPEPVMSGWRRRAIAVLRRWLGGLHRRAPGPEAVNSGWRHALADLLYGTTSWLAGHAQRRRQTAHTLHLVQAVRAVAQRDPGCRVLVVLNVQACHHVRQALKAYPDVQVVDYRQL